MGELIDQDQEHLGLLRLGFFIMSAVTGALSMLSLIYLGLGGLIASGALPMNGGAKADPRFIGGYFRRSAAFFLLLGATVTFMTYFAGRSLGERGHSTFCVVLAALCCFQFPFGFRCENL